MLTVSNCNDDEESLGRATFRHCSVTYLPPNQHNSGYGEGGEIT